MDAVRLIVHTLKSSAASVGALEFSRTCADTEMMIRRSRADVGAPAR